MMAMKERMLPRIRKKFLRNITPTPAAAQSLPSEIETPSDDTIEKTVIFFYDESTFQANDDQPT